MENKEIENKLDNIEKQLENLKKRKKDFWDIFQSFATILIPAAIALAGYFISNGIKMAEIRVAETNAKVAQAELVNKFMASLTSTSDVERSIAVDAILIAIPGYGASLARSVAENDTSEKVRNSAQSSLNKRLLKLIRELFSDQANERKLAAQVLLKGWNSDPILVKKLLEFAKSHFDNNNGIYNTVIILNSIDNEPLIKHKEDVLKFLNKAESKGPNTKSIVKQVRQRF